MYRIVWSAHAEKSLRKLEHSIAKRIYEKVGELANNPFRNSTRLVGESGYRLRIGDWRVIFEVDRQTISILVLKVGHRSEIYE